MKKIFLSILLFSFFCSITAFSQNVNNIQELKNALADAKSGTVITLQSGTYLIGNIILPDGVSLKGNSYKDTLIDATGFDYGIERAENCSLTDFTITSAIQVGIKLSSTEQVKVERIMVRNSSTALLVDNSHSIAINNFISAKNYAGTNFINSNYVNFVNNTVAYTESTAIRVINCNNSSFFNNLFAFCAMGINTVEPNENTVIDHNLYIASKQGKEAGDTAMRRKIEGWATLTGHDKYSYIDTVTFANEAAYDFRPVSTVSWSPVSATTSNRGIAMLNGVTVQPLDIDGNPRIGLPDIGAYETVFNAPYPADGTFTIETGRIVSAGLYDTNGKLVNYLFNNLPLRPGIYEYWLPTRTFEGKNINTGSYTLKIVESNVDLKYVSAAGNGDSDMSKNYFGTPKHRISLDPLVVGFNNTDNLIVSQSGFESGEFIRSYSDDMSHLIWSHSGGGNGVGIAVDDNNNIYLARSGATIYRFNGTTGEYAPFVNDSVSINFDDDFKNVKGMAWLNGQLIIAANDTIYSLSGDLFNNIFDFKVNGVSSLSSDKRKNCLYFVNDGIIRYILSEGMGALNIEEKATLIAANNNRIAVYSEETAKITLYDVSDLENAKVLTTIGTGGRSFGEINPYALWNPRFLALAEDGRIAVADTPRTLVYDINGDNILMHSGMWGQGISYGFFNSDGGDARFFNINSGYDIVIDNENNEWKYGTHWYHDIDRYDSSKNESDTPVFYFSVDDRNFGIYREQRENTPSGIAIKSMNTQTGEAKTIGRYFYATEVADNNFMMFYQEDTNKDGVVNDEDGAIPVYEADGTPVRDRIFEGYFNNTDVMRDGSIFMPTHIPVYIKQIGLNDNGVPQYDIAGRKVVYLTNNGEPSFISPYDYETVERIMVRGDMGVKDDLSFVAPIGMTSGAGPCPATEHAGSTDMAGFTADGEIRWVRAMNPKGMRMGLHGITNIAGITIAGRGMICEFETFDDDGLGLGTLGSPRDMGWHGMWLDNHRQVVGYIGNDDKPYIIVGDYASQSYHMMEVTGLDELKYKNIPVTIEAAQAASLANAQARDFGTYPVPPPPSIELARLDHELPIDGDLNKWRQLTYVEPLIISSDDPSNNSAVIRMGYTDKGIYVNIVKFDNNLVFHQTEVGKHYLQDGIEMNINTFWNAWKYNVTRLDWSEDICWRDRFMGPVFGTDSFLDRTVLPLNIDVFETSDVPERKILEAASGVDMSKCQMMVIEFLLTPAALEGANPPVVLKSGETFILGFSINDNDVIGADSYEGLISWPATYGAFSRENDLATVTLK